MDVNRHPRAADQPVSGRRRLHLLRQRTAFRQLGGRRYRHQPRRWTDRPALHHLRAGDRSRSPASAKTISTTTTSTAFFEDSWKITSEPDVESGRPLRNAADSATAEAEHHHAADHAVHVDHQHRQQQFRSAHRHGMGTSAKEPCYAPDTACSTRKTTNSTYYATRVENGVFQQTYNCNPTTCPTLTFPNLIFTPPGPAPQAPFAGALTPQSHSVHRRPP